MDFELFGVRISTGQNVSVKATREGDLYIAQNLPPYTLAAAAGRGWQVMSTSGAAALEVRPSTAALGTLWNGEAGGGKSYVIDRMFAHLLAGPSSGYKWALWACVQEEVSAIGDADITAIQSMNGKANYGGNARFDIDDTVVDDGWFPWTDSQDVTSADGPTKIANVEGRMIIPPKCGLSLHVVGKDSCSMIVGCSWYEVQLDLG